jgi:hypothetical protein
LFILASIACAVWLIMAVLGQADAITEALTGSVRRAGTIGKSVVCASCGASNEAGATQCARCGKEL